jgi:hypothetical protein
MQTPPSTPTATVAPGAPRRLLYIKRSKSNPALSDRIAFEALHALEEIEENMDEDARALYPHHVRDIQDYKLTFQHDYPERAEEYNDTVPFLEDATTMLQTMEQEAAAVDTAAAVAAP